MRTTTLLVAKLLVIQYVALILTFFWLLALDSLGSITNSALLLLSFTLLVGTSLSITSLVMIEREAMRGSARPMTPAAAKTTTRSASLFQLDPEQVRPFLLHDLGLDWPGGEGPREVHIERVWPAGREALAVEWSFELDDLGRYSLFVTPTQPDDPPGPDVRAPALVDGVLRGVRIELQDRGILIHSPDHDPALLHLPVCLDPTVMNDRLTGFWRDAGGGPRQPSRVGVQVLSYRARRRAHGPAADLGG